jgi:putative membrane protein
MSQSWPALNASLNATSALLLALGYIMIRRGRTRTHTSFMLGACGVTVAFLVSYLLYHARVGSVRFTGGGWIRPVYFAVLISHTVLAVTIVPLVVRTLWLAARRRFEAHRALARWTLPLWFYVSISGVVVYWMLYRVSWGPA